MQELYCFDTAPAGAIVSRLTNDTQAVNVNQLDFLNVFKYFIYRRGNLICYV